MANQYWSGTQVRVRGVYSTPAGIAVDPVTVVCQVMAPGDDVESFIYGTDAEVIRDTGGSYYLDVNTESTGIYHYRWQSDNPPAAAEGHFVIASAFGGA